MRHPAVRVAIVFNLGLGDFEEEFILSVISQVSL